MADSPRYIAWVQTAQKTPLPAVTVWAERDREIKWEEGSERYYIGGGGGARNYISGFEGSQAVPACPLV
jgi:hypothetical protein